MTHTDGQGSHETGAGGGAVDGAFVPVPDGDEIATFWQLARGRAGLGRLAEIVGTGARASVPPPAWAFGDDPAEADRRLARVLDRTTTATTVAARELDDAGQPLPEPGDLSIVTDGRGHPRALLRTTHVRRVRFADVDAEHARLEGECDGSLAAWRQVYGAVLRDGAAAVGRTFDDDTEVVLERFEVRFPTRSRRLARATEV